MTGAGAQAAGRPAPAEPTLEPRTDTELQIAHVAALLTVAAQLQDLQPTREELLVAQAVEMIAAAGRAMGAAAELLRLAEHEHLMELFRSNGFEEISDPTAVFDSRPTSSSSGSVDGELVDDGMEIRVGVLPVVEVD